MLPKQQQVLEHNIRYITPQIFKIFEENDDLQNSIMIMSFWWSLDNVIRIARRWW